MKKFLMALAVAGISLTSLAQTVEVVEVPVKKHSVQTNGFWSNWFVSVGGGVQFFNGVPNGSANIGDRITPAITASVGKWHTPGFGWRVAYNGFKLKNYASNYDDDNSYGNIHADAMFNLSNLFCGYNEKRVWNFIPYMGLGLLIEGESDTRDFAGNFGVLNTWRLGKHWGLNLDLACAMTEKGWDGAAIAASGHDKVISATIGLTYKFNKTGWEKTPDVDALVAMNAAQLAELNAQLQKSESDNAALKEQLKRQPKTVTNTVEKILAAPQSVFFSINSSRIASKKEIVNLKSFAEAAKANKDAKIYVTGYADSATGSAAYNQKLSAARAEAVKAELVKLGVAESAIVAEGKGGVNVETPAYLNRRVIVEIK